MAKNRSVNKFWKVISLISVISALFILIICFVWLLYPYKTVSIENFQTDKDEYISGTVINYSFKATKYTWAQSVVTRTLVDTVTYSIDSFITSIQTGDSCVTSNHLNIPTNVNQGLYTLHLIYRSQVNPIRIIEYEVISNEFTITNEVK
jgi:hypothetical protein